MLLFRLTFSISVNYDGSRLGNGFPLNIGYNVAASHKGTVLVTHVHKFTPKCRYHRHDAAQFGFDVAKVVALLVFLSNKGVEARCAGTFTIDVPQELSRCGGYDGIGFGSLDCVDLL